MSAVGRAKRFVRSAHPPPFRLTERDITILAHVAQHRFVSSDHIAALDGGSKQNVLRCLRTLFDHGYLDRPHAQLAHMPLTGPRPMVYGLGRRGAQTLREYGHRLNDAVDWSERNKRAGAIFIGHTLAIADVMVGVELACRDRQDVTLLRSEQIVAEAPEATRSAREPLRLELHGLRNAFGVSSVVPDGLFGLSFADGTAAYFLLELDRSTMPVTRSRLDCSSYHRKLALYWEAWKRQRHVEQFGIEHIRVLTVTDSRTRIENMLAAVREITGPKGSNLFLFAEKAALTAGSPLSVSWTTGAQRQVSLID